MMQRTSAALLPLMTALACCGPYATTTTAAGETEGATATTRGAPSTSGAGTTATSSAGDETAPTEATAQTTDAATSGVTTDCDFVCEDDTPRGTAECDPFQQDCPEGQKCAAWANDGGDAWNSLKCVPVTGDGQVGDPCTIPDGSLPGEDTCAKGLMCWYVDAQHEGTCVAWCAGSPEAPSCAPKTECWIPGSGIPSLCLAGCDPLVQSCQGLDQICIPDARGGFTCARDGSEDMHPTGSPCTFMNQCNAGNLCVSSDEHPHPECQGSSGCCAPFCDVTDPQCPNEPPDLECAPWYEREQSAPPGLEDVGVCVVAP